jgi:acetylornithine deacetylase/succinyl-diaminopimelate desuccinylase-like protein
MTRFWLALVLAATLAAGPAAQAAAPDPLAEEATAKLQALLRIDTTNPPGNEAEAAKLVAGWLRAEGIEARIYPSAPGRANVVARLKGRGDRQPLLLLNHLDVVTAEPSGWKQPPFSGAIVDGALWGRGALDMKGLGVMELMAFLSLHRNQVPLARDVIFCATADEEAGGDWGARWMLEHHPEEVDASELLNEGGAGLSMPNGPVMGIQTAERGVMWVRVTAHGEPGHGSILRPDGATRRLVRALSRLEAAPPHMELIPETRGMLKALAEAETGVRAWALHGLSQPWLLPLIGPRAIATDTNLAGMLGSTWNTTVLTAGNKVNVMPGAATAEIDMRVLPGHTADELLGWLKRTLADDGLTYEVIHGRNPTVTPAGGPLYAALEKAIAAEYPGIKTVPVLTPGGGTDSAVFRDRGVAAFGCMPIVMPASQLATMHGHNEHITLEQIARGTRVVTAAVEAASR